MTEIKVTKWIDLGDNTIKLFCKETDDNPIDMDSHFYTIEAINNNAIKTVFTDCNLQYQEPDETDGDWLVHVYVYTYGAISL